MIISESNLRRLICKCILEAREVDQNDDNENDFEDIQIAREAYEKRCELQRELQSE